MYANNHFSAKSVANAATIKHKLGQPLAANIRRAFVERYPDLKGIVKILPYSLLQISSFEHVAFWILSTTSMPVDDLAEDRVLAVELRRGAARDVELAVGRSLGGRCAPCRRHRACCAASW